MEKIEILKDEYDELIDAKAHLEELQNRGVDNWGGYVGSRYYCNECDNETSWIDMDDSTCPKCGAEEDSW